MQRSSRSLSQFDALHFSLPLLSFMVIFRESIANPRPPNVFVKLIEIPTAGLPSNYLWFSLVLIDWIPFPLLVMSGSLPLFCLRLSAFGMLVCEVCYYLCLRVQWKNRFVFWFRVLIVAFLRLLDRVPLIGLYLIIRFELFLIDEWLSCLSRLWTFCWWYSEGGIDYRLHLLVIIADIHNSARLFPPLPLQPYPTLRHRSRGEDEEGREVLNQLNRIFQWLYTATIPWNQAKKGFVSLLEILHSGHISGSRRATDTKLSLNLRRSASEGRSGGNQINKFGSHRIASLNRLLLSLFWNYNNNINISYSFLTLFFFKNFVENSYSSFFVMIRR